MWFIKFVSSSIGKKCIMAVTGLCLLLFLAIHVFGNAAIFFGHEAFQTYANALHSLPVLVYIFTFGLAVVFALHAYFGISLYIKNMAIRTTRYAVTTRVYKRTLASSTMPYTGIIILLFVLCHVFVFVVTSEESAIAELVQTKLSGILFGALYLVAFCALALHLSHGFWSMLQTFGINHPRYNGLITFLTYLVPVFLLLFFAAIVLYFMTGLGMSF